MGSINKHTIVGTVGKDPVLRTTQAGKTVCEISVATSDGDKDQQGNNLTNWHKVICFGTVADFVGKYVVKGTLVYAEGPVKLRNFLGKDGNKVYMKETIAYKVEALSKSTRNDSPATYTPGTTAPVAGSQVNSMAEVFENLPPGPAAAAPAAQQPPPQYAPGSQVAGQEHTQQAPPPTQAPAENKSEFTPPPGFKLIAEHEAQQEDDLPF